MSEAEKDLYMRIGKLEDGIADLKVEGARTYRDLIGHHEMDKVNSAYMKEALEQLKEATKDPHAGKSTFARWLSAVLTPQTIAIIMAIIAALVGAKL
jgi:hypothetical protein